MICSNFYRITHRLREIWCESLVMTLKYRQGHRQLYHLKAVVWFLISNFSFCGRIVYNFRDTGRGNDNICWNDLQMSFKIIERGTSRKLIYELLLVLYSNFRRITHRFRDTSCDIRTNGQTDKFTMTKTALCIASRGKTLTRYKYQYTSTSSWN